MYGPKTTTPGGKALKFYASQRLEIKKVGPEKEGDELIGTQVRVKCIKNKVSAPYGEGATVLTFNKGINRAAEISVVGEELGIIKKKGHTFYLDCDEEIEGYDKDENTGEIKIATYKKKLIEQLEKDNNLMDLISRLVIEKLEEKNKGAVE